MEPLVHPATKLQLGAIIAQLAGSYVFHGPAAVGKRHSAIWLAQRLNCANGVGGDDCVNCRLVRAGNFPDLVTVAAEESAKITIAQVQQLQQDLTLSRYHSAGTRLVVVDASGGITLEAQNCLLKTIEEPPPATLMIIITTQIESLLPTVRSRCYGVYFAPLPEAQIKAYLLNAKLSSEQEGATVAALSAGAVGLAVRLANEPHELKSRVAAAKLALDTLDQSLFERLAAAPGLSEPSFNLTVFVDQVAAYLRNLARRLAEQPGKAMELEAIARKLAAVERYWRHLGANVNQRVALEGLLLEL